MRWNEHTLRRAETVIAVMVVALLIVAYPCVEGAMTDGKSGWNPQAWRGYPERIGTWWRLTMQVVVGAASESDPSSR